jgi:hypothetical protein
VMLAPMFAARGLEGVIIVCAAANLLCLALVLATRKGLNRG